MLGADEHDRPAVAGGDVRHHAGLVLRGHVQHVVVHRRDARRRRRDRVGHRVGEVPPNQRVDVPVQGRREQQALAVRLHLVEELAHLRQEAHVGHVVRLVERGDIDVAELAGALLDQVGEPARCRDDDVGAAAEAVDLPAEGRTADDDPDLEADRVRERLERVVDLHRQLPRGDEDQATRTLRGGTPAREPRDHRQAEAERLAGAGLAAAEEVTAGEGVRDRRGLDGERCLDAVLRQRGDEGVGEAQLGERGQRALEDRGRGVVGNRRLLGLPALTRRVGARGGGGATGRALAVPLAAGRALRRPLGTGRGRGCRQEEPPDVARHGEAAALITRTSPGTR